MSIRLRALDLVEVMVSLSLPSSAALCSPFLPLGESSNPPTNRQASPLPSPPLHLDRFCRRLPPPRSTSRNRRYRSHLSLSHPPPNDLERYLRQHHQLCLAHRHSRRANAHRPDSPCRPLFLRFGGSLCRSAAEGSTHRHRCSSQGNQALCYEEDGGVGDGRGFARGGRWRGCDGGAGSGGVDLRRVLPVRPFSPLPSCCLEVNESPRAETSKTPDPSSPPSLARARPPPSPLTSSPSTSTTASRSTLRGCPPSLPPGTSPPSSRSGRSRQRWRVNSPSAPEARRSSYRNEGRSWQGCWRW
jgi:hypothetical protein